MLKKFLVTIIVFSILVIGINNSQLAFAGICADGDGDGFCAPPIGEDCDDTVSTIYPGAPDILGDGIDQDCDGVDGTVSVQVVGGEILPIHTTSLLVAGVKANYSILTALAVVGVGAGFAFLFFVNKFVGSWRIWAKALSFSNFRY